MESEAGMCDVKSFLPPAVASATFTAMRIFVLLLCALAALVQAQPSGPLSFDFTSPSSALRDLSGTYAETNDGLAALVVVDHQPDGRLAGSIKMHYAESLMVLDATVPMRGRVSGVAGRRVNGWMSGRGPFTGWFLVQPLRGTITMSFAQTFDAEHGTISGREFIRACLTDGRCKTLRTNSVFALPPGQNGAWSLALDLTTTNNRVAGTGAVMLAGGRTLDCNVRGSFNARSQLSTLRLTGTDPARRFALTLQLGPANEVRRLRGSLLGQRLAAP
jgi:hypothetical protein